MMTAENQSSKTMRIDIPAAVHPGRRMRGVARSQEGGASPPRLTFGEIAVKNSDFSELFQNVYDSAFITELNGKIVDANVRATQSFLYSREQFKQSVIMDVIMGMTDAVLATIGENLQNDRFTLIQAECARQDGAMIPSEISTCKVDLSGTPYLCFFIRDITARKEAEDALQAAHDNLEREVRERTRINEELSLEIAERKRIELELNQAIEKLQEHDRAKSQFVSNVSHELKTPLSSINYIAGNMSKGIAGPMSEKGKMYLTMIREDCQRLHRTVADILDMSRIESNTLRLNLVKVNFERFLRRTVESLRMQIEAQGLRLEIVVEGAGFIECDPQKMERVIFNVVKNAIKYNTTNGFIQVRLGTSSEEGGRHVVEVIDSGIGIEARYLPRITERFFRVGEYVSGAGLGLAICKDLLMRHGGGMAISSPPAGYSKGTQVSLHLPADDPVVVRAITALFEPAGFVVTSVENGPDVLERAIQVKPDMILLKEVLPRLNGAAVAGLIDVMPSLSAIPVIIYGDRISGDSPQPVTAKCVRQQLSSSQGKILLDAVQSVPL